jgi:hypothetical protein
MARSSTKIKIKRHHWALKAKRKKELNKAGKLKK